MDNNQHFYSPTVTSPQRSLSQQSIFDPTQFQLLYDQMQNNQDFLQQMQGVLVMQSYNLTSENEVSQSFQFHRTNSNPMMSVQDDESVNNKKMIENLQSFQSMNSQTDIELTPQSNAGYNQFYIDPTINGLFQEQYREENSQLSESNEQQEQHQASEAEQFQASGPQLDPSMITPEYFQMFNQFYQMFSQLQSNMPTDQQQNLNDPLFLQNLMFTFFTQSAQSQANEHDQAPQSPKNYRNYNSNLPLAAIPESKESMLEENSQWQTVKTNKFGNLMSASIGKDGNQHHCSCCLAHQDSKRKSCSNFNVGAIQGTNQSQDYFGKRIDGCSSNRTSQVFNNPFNLESANPTPIGAKPAEAQTNYYITGTNLNQNLNTVFLQQSNDLNMQSILEMRKQSEDLNTHNQILHKYNLSIPEPQAQDQNMIIVSPLMSPQQQQRRTQEDPNCQILSPQQIQQNKVIEYMIDNNDFSNYKSRREVIKGERMCRTLSRSISKGSVSQVHHRHQFSIYSQNNQVNATHQHAPSYIPESEQNFFSELKINKINPYQEPLANHHGIERNPYFFFSPQVNSKAIVQRGSCFEDLISDQDPNNCLSPSAQERINELQRGKENLMKSKTRKNLHKDTQQKVFEIKDLKKSQSKKSYHGRKKSYNGASNKENQKLMQSNYQQHYELSQENIIQSPSNQDLMFSMDEQPMPQQYSQKDYNTFKSLNSVAQQKYASNNVTANYVLSENACSPNQYSNLKFNIGQRDSIAPSEVSQAIQALRIKPQYTEAQNQLLPERTEFTKPGKEIHIIKKPIQTEESKKIQERLTKYYQSKQKEEDAQKNRYSHHRLEAQGHLQNQTHNDTDMMSMTKTLSSFKSLMMKTMSQMSMQQDNNIQHQYIQGQTQRALNGGNKGNQKNAHGNQSMNVSSIQDDLSCADYSENLTKIISPKNLYNGSLANIKYRNPQVKEQFSTQDEAYSTKKSQATEKVPVISRSCLPNSLYFKMHKQTGEETLSLKYNSRQPSLCFCGQLTCNCDKQSKKDLLGHFQNFLQEMDKHQQSYHGSFPNKDSLYASPIPNIGNQSNHDFLLSNFHMIGMGRSSSLNSRLSRANPGGASQRQSSVGGNQYPKMKRFSSGSTLNINMPLKRIVNNLQHCQSTHVLADNKGLIPNEKEDIILKVKKASDLDANTTLTRTQASSQGGLEKLDTNKEEEIRLINLEKDIMHKAFIEKSHKLNLQSDQRAELMLRIQKHKEGQRTNQNSSIGNESQGDFSLKNFSSHNTTNTTQSLFAKVQSQNELNNPYLLQ